MQTGVAGASIAGRGKMRYQRRLLLSVILRWPRSGPRRMRPRRPGRRPSRLASLAPQGDGKDACTSLRLEIHRHAVDAIAQVRGRRAVVEDVAEMAAAAAAVHLGAHHAPAAIGYGLDRAGLRIVEAWPAGAALELLLRAEQRLLAAGAVERAGALLVIERTAARPFGAVLAHDVELLGREQLLPLGFRMRHGILLGVRVRAHGLHLLHDRVIMG